MAQKWPKTIELCKMHSLFIATKLVRHFHPPPLHIGFYRSKYGIEIWLKSPPLWGFSPTAAFRASFSLCFPSIRFFFTFSTFLLYALSRVSFPSFRSSLYPPQPSRSRGLTAHTLISPATGSGPWGVLCKLPHRVRAELGHQMVCALHFELKTAILVIAIYIEFVFLETTCQIVA